MTTVVSIANTLAIVACDSYVDSLDGGSPGLLKIYSGTPPTLADDALSGNTLLGTLTFSNPAFGSAVDLNPGARATASAITGDTSADATGTATFYRATNSAGTVKFQGSVGLTGSGASLELNAVAIVAGAAINVTAMTFTQPEA